MQFSSNEQCKNFINKVTGNFTNFVNDESKNLLIETFCRVNRMNSQALKKVCEKLELSVNEVKSSVDKLCEKNIELGDSLKSVYGEQLCYKLLKDINEKSDWYRYILVESDIIDSSYSNDYEKLFNQFKEIKLNVYKFMKDMSREKLNIIVSQLYEFFEKFEKYLEGFNAKVVKVEIDNLKSLKKDSSHGLIDWKHFQVSINELVKEIKDIKKFITPDDIQEKTDINVKEFALQFDIKFKKVVQGIEFHFNVLENLF